MKIRFLSVTAVLAAVLCLFPTGVLANDLVKDQYNEGDPFDKGTIDLLEPIGQEFVPSLSPLVGVEVYLNTMNTGYGDATITVNIREGTIDGVLVGTASQPVSDPWDGWLYFEFASPVPVTTGATYVLEVASTNPTHGAYATPDEYPSGQMISEGAVRSGFDLNFRTFAPALHETSGGGTDDVSGGPVTYGFNAQQLDGIGNAKGQFHLRSRQTGSEIHADITYLVVDTNTGDAWLGGVITKTNQPDWEELEIVFRVQDNGQGSKATGPDAVSPVLVGTGVAATALDMPQFVLYDWTNGNVQVK
jgi:hypothetical protein